MKHELTRENYTSNIGHQYYSKWDDIIIVWGRSRWRLVAYVKALITRHKMARAFLETGQTRFDMPHSPPQIKLDAAYGRLKGSVS